MKDIGSLATLIVVLCFLGFPQAASAFYYDPGFGSVMTQVVFASWLAGIVVLGRLRKTIWRFIKRLIEVIR